MPKQPHLRETGERTTVFLEDGNGLLAPVSLSLPKGESSAMLKDSLTALVSKGAYASSLPEGFQGVLPRRYGSKECIRG